MDFLDPRKRRYHKIRLIVGYFLVAIAIGLGTIILVYSTNGYGINTHTGQVIENGLLFVDSKPGGAQIFLNGQNKNTTPARLIVPGGDYTLTLKRPGYRNWQRSFTLEPSVVSRYVYPFLFPVNPRVTAMAKYSSLPPLFSESPDQHWLLVQKPDGSSSASFDIYDTTNLTKAPTSVSLPAGLLSDTEPGMPAQFKTVEWSSDNDNLLLEHTFSGGTEYIVFNRTKPEDSFNVNKTFSVDPTQVALFNKHVEQLYIYDAKTKALQLGTVKSGKLFPVLSDVLAFKPYGTDLISYVTDKNMPAGTVQARIWNNNKTFPLYSFKAGQKYLIDAAQYSGHWYYFAGSDVEGKVNIYEDPLSLINNTKTGRAIPTLALNVGEANKAGFSTNARFIEVEHGQRFGIYDLETKTRYAFKLKAPLSQPLTWMDGNRLIGQSNGQVFITDYDSTNQQKLVPSIEPDGGLFSQDYNHMLTFQTQKDGSVKLVNVDMRAGADLPRQ